VLAKFPIIIIFVGDTTTSIFFSNPRAYQRRRHVLSKLVRFNLNPNHKSSPFSTSTQHDLNARSYKWNHGTVSYVPYPTYNTNFFSATSFCKQSLRLFCTNMVKLLSHSCFIETVHRLYLEICGCNHVPATPLKNFGSTPHHF